MHTCSCCISRLHGTERRSNAPSSACSNPWSVQTELLIKRLETIQLKHGFTGARNKRAARVLDTNHQGQRKRTGAHLVRQIVLLERWDRGGQHVRFEFLV
eukprot:2000612-Pyramimonas_sp.AAC.1